MKNVFKILLAVLACAFVSCSGEKDEAAESLTVDMGKSSGIIIPEPAVTRSCEQEGRLDNGIGAIAGAYFTFPNPKISWSLVESPQLSEVRVVVLKLSLKSPKIGGEYTCVFSDTILGNMYYKRVPITETEFEVKLWDGLLGKGALAANSTQSLIDSQGYTACRLKCGGLTIPPNSGQFSVTGTWELLAVRKKYASEGSADFEETPIKVQGSFTVDNSLN